jgi:hypothetical protein
MGLAALDEQARERLGDEDRLGLGAVRVEVAQGGADPATVPDRPGKLRRAAP